MEDAFAQTDIEITNALSKRTKPYLNTSSFSSFNF